MVGGNMQTNSLPDRYVCHNKFRGWLEMKKDNGRLRTGQRILMEKLVERGDTVLLVRYRANNIMEIEDLNGNLLQYVDLRDVFCLSPGAAGVFLIRTLVLALNN